MDGITRRQTTHQSTQYCKITPDGRLTEISIDEFHRLRDAANRNPFDITIPRVQRSTFHYNLLWFVTPEGIERHQLSEEDVMHMLDVARSQKLWFLAFFYGIFPTNNATKLQHLSYTCIVPKTNSTLYTKILQYMKHHIFPNLSGRSSKLTCVDDQHLPRNPVHELTEEECKSIVQCFERLGSSYKQTYKWKGIDVVPYRLYQNNYIEMIRVVPLKEYNLIYGTSMEGVYNVPPRHQPFLFDINGETYCDMWESFLVYGKNKTLFRLCECGPISSSPKEEVEKEVEEEKQKETLEVTTVRITPRPKKRQKRT